MIESILKQSVKNVIEALGKPGPVADFQAILEEERAGKNRKTLVKWLEQQDAQGSGPTPEADSTVDASAPEVEPVYVEPVVEEPPGWEFGPIKGYVPIGDLIDHLCQERDRLQRSTSCGVENIIVHLSDIKISVR